ncbi:hypothetical protein MTBSS4_190012 [Magnetospirillum sp. SS-4]|nr:hypothetical protein MTBSS4_190012 [Magnetospirillum sp. SS-4]
MMPSGGPPTSPRASARTSRRTGIGGSAAPRFHVPDRLSVIVLIPDDHQHTEFVSKHLTRNTMLRNIYHV